MIEDIVFTLVDKFPEADFDLGYDDRFKKYVIITNNFDMYMKSTRFRKILEILRIKYKDIKFYCIYKSRLYED